jgi:hypothetical protein
VKLDDPALDSTAAIDGGPRLLQALRDQIAFMRAVNPFWRERLSQAGLTSRKSSGSTTSPASRP